jgi:vancomycin resistance protein VanJ
MAAKKHARPSCLARFAATWGVAILWSFAVTLVAWNLLRVYPGDRWLLVRVGNYFAPWLMMAAFAALLIASIGRRPWLGRLLAVLCLVFVVRYWPVLVPRFHLTSASASAPTFRLRVMTFNAHYSNEDGQGVARMIRAENPDLVALQEFTSPLSSSLPSELASDYPYALLDDAELPRLGLISRYPLIVRSPPPGSWRTLAAALTTPVGEVSLWNVHSASSVSQSGWETQRQTFLAIARQVTAQRVPTIVLGDFNTTDQAENYRLIADHLTDVHRAVGWGLGFTFPGRWLDESGLSLPVATPMLRIDHVFVSEHWMPEDVRVVPEGPGSDHFPVVTTLRWTG